MSKKVLVLVLSAVLMMALSIGATSAWAAKPIKLTYSSFFPPNHIQSKLAAAWCKEVGKRTKGRVQVQFFPGQTLTKAKQIYDGVVQDMSDIGFCLFAYNRGRFPLMEVVDLPLGYKSGKVATQVANEVYQKFKPKELDDVKVMYLSAHGPGLLFTKNKPVRTMEDLKGMKIRAHGTTAKVVKALGGTPVAMPMPELYQALQRGVVDGALYPMEVNKGWKMADVVDYCTENYVNAYTSTFYVVMNKGKWNALPKDIQAIIMQINKDWIPKCGAAWDSSDAAGRKLMLKKGRKFIPLTAKEAARWKKATDPVLGEYVKEASAKGVPAKAALDFTRKTLEELQK